MAKPKVEIKSRFSNTGEAEQATQPQVSEIEQDSTAQPEHSTEAATGFNLQPRSKPEAKTRRVNAVFRPSLYEKFAQIAQGKGYSVNDLLNQLVENFIQNN